MIANKLTDIVSILYDKMSAIMDDNTTFADWLDEQMGIKGFSQSELARRAGLSRQAISDYLNRKRTYPDERALQAIAHAFGYPVEQVYRAAGILPPSSQPTERKTLIEHMLDQLSDEEQEDILKYIEFRLEQYKEKEKKRLELERASRRQPREA